MTVPPLRLIGGKLIVSPQVFKTHHCSSFRGVSVTKQPAAETIYFLFTSHVDVNGHVTCVQVDGDADAELKQR